MTRVVLTAALALALAFGAVACKSGPNLSQNEARKEVEQLMTLYTDARAKFVIQKQKLEQAEDCGRATALAQAARAWEDEANMQAGDTQSVTNLRMELDQAEKTCTAKE